MTGDRNTRQELIALTQALVEQGAQITTAFAARHGLHRADAQALTLVVAAQDAGALISAGALSERLALTSGAITGVLDRLERADHLARVREGADRRKVMLRATPAGRALVEGLLLPLEARSHAAMDHFTPAELDVAHRFLTITAEAMTSSRRSLTTQTGDTPTTSSQSDHTPKT